MISTMSPKGDKVVLEFEVGKLNQNLIDLLTMMEIANKSRASDEDIKNLSDEITADWWNKNKNRLLDENRR
jgi:hypothetical protein